MSIFSALYVGNVVHRRLRPVRHELAYRVFNLFVDVDEIADLPRRIPLFGYNRFNLLCVRDRDHGPGDGTPIASHVRALAASAHTDRAVARIFMFTYPRVLGYVFNPLTVYYGFDAEGGLALMIYEVNNTFGERHTYVLPFTGATQCCRKALHVSPFNQVEGGYAFDVSVPGETLKIAISFDTDEGPCLKAWFTGERRPLTTRAMLTCFLALPLQSLKVIGGIHLEAGRLWLKGLRLKPRPPRPAQAITIIEPDQAQS